jgi:hypothetical protein
VNPQEWLALLIEQGPALRAAGYSSLDINGDHISARLAPPYGEPLPQRGQIVATVADVRALAGDPEPDSEVDALDDPDSYPGGVVPGYERDEDDA